MSKCRDLLEGHAALAAPELLGALISHRTATGLVRVRITEVEAYGGVGEDPGSHAYRRQTPRCASMFDEPGTAYVYRSHGLHWMLNIVTCPTGSAGAVLVRAGEVVDGIELARSRRASARVEWDLARGPGRLAAALGITGHLDGADLLDPDSPLRLELPSRSSGPVMVSARTGVAGAGADTPWRFHLDDATVSPYRPAAARGSTQRPIGSR